MQFMADESTNLQNETIRLLAEELRTDHHFTMPYCTWLNCSVKRLGKDIRRVIRYLFFELQQQHT